MIIRLWVPGTVPPGLAERAVEAAWPGARTITSPAAPPLPPGGRTAGGSLRLARPEILPLSTGHDLEAPLRALAGAAAGLAAGERAVWQVLTRPVAGGPASPGAPRRPPAARRPPRPLPLRLAGRLLAAVVLRRRRRTSRAPARPGPELAPEVRAALGKLAAPQWETVVRYAVTVPAPPAGQQAEARARLRGLAHALAAPAALFTGMNWLARRRLRRPAAVLAGPAAGAGRPAVGRRARRAGAAARRPGASRPGPRRGPRRRPAARRARPRPPRPPAGRVGCGGAAAGRAWRSPTPATTCGSAGRPGPARPP